MVNPTGIQQVTFKQQSRTPDRLTADTIPEKLHLAMATTRCRGQDKLHPEHRPCVISHVCLKTITKGVQTLPDPGAKEEAAPFPGCLGVGGCFVYTVPGNNMITLDSPPTAGLIVCLI